MDKMESTRHQLINCLMKDENQYISSEKLSEKLHMSRTAVEEFLHELKKDGYLIEYIPNRGYRMIGCQEQISDSTIRQGLQTSWLGQTIIHKETIASTQLFAHKKARENAKHGTVVIADEQTAGKGRMNRPWHSKKGKGVWMSFILRPQMSPQFAPQLTFLTSTVLASVFAKEIGIDARIKWPNDILFHDKKVAGVLTEMQADQDHIRYVVIGIGINVNHTQADIPANIRHQATSLKIATKQHWQIKKLIQKILETFEKDYTTYLKTGFAFVKSNWEKRGYKLGQDVWVRTLSDRFKAVCYGIADDGSLLVEKNGHVKRLYSAEIEWNNSGKQ